MVVLSKVERETLINFNEEESTATVYTCNKSLIKKLARFAAKSTLCIMLSEDDWSRTYKVPKSWVSIRFPSMHNAETRAKRAALAKKLSEKKRENLSKGDIR